MTRLCLFFIVLTSLAASTFAQTITVRTAHATGAMKITNANDVCSAVRRTKSGGWITVAELTLHRPSGDLVFGPGSVIQPGNDRGRGLVQILHQRCDHDHPTTQDHALQPK